MNEEENHDRARLALEKLRIEGEFRLREAELALKREELQKGRTVALLVTVLIAAITGLLGMTLGAILLVRINKASKDPQSLSSSQTITIDTPSLQNSQLTMNLLALEDPHLTAEAKRLADYFREHGSNSGNGILHVKIVDNMPSCCKDYISHYKAGTTYILRAYFRDPDVLFKEYAHLVLLSDETHIRMSDENSDVFDLEDGLTTYFPCSFSNHALWGEMSAQNKSLHFDASNLNNAFTFADTIQDRSLIWGGTFWDLRQRLGRDTTDTLLLSAWQSLQPSDISDSADRAFANSLIKQDQLLQGGQHISIIRSVFQKRKLKL